MKIHTNTNNEIEITTEAEVLTSGGAMIVIRRGSGNTQIELNILHYPDDDPISDEELTSKISAAFNAPARDSRWQETVDFIILACKLLDKIKSKLLAFEVGEETNDPTFLRNIRRMLNECSRVVLPRLAFALDAHLMDVESLLGDILLANEAENEPSQTDPSPISPAQPVSVPAVSADASNTNSLQNSSDGQTAKSDKPRTELPASLTERLKPFQQKNKTDGTSGPTEPPPTKP